MAIFAILNKDTEELIFDQLYYNGEKYNMGYYYFDHICHPGKT